VIIFLTDGRCELEGGPITTPDCEAQARQRIQAANNAKIRIYTIAFTEAAFQTSTGNPLYGTFLNELATRTGGKYFAAEKSESALLNVYIQILADLFSLSEVTVKPSVTVPIEISFEIPEGLRQTVFAILKFEPNITVTLYKPDGSQLMYNTADVKHSSSEKSETIGILDPDPGMWKLSLDGYGTATVINYPFPESDLHMNLISPGSVIPAGKPVTVLAEILNSNGARKTLGNVQGLLTSPTVDKEPLSIKTSADGVYSTDIVDTSAVGQYKIRFFTPAEAQSTAELNSSVTVTVVNGYWINIVQPQAGSTYPANMPLEVKVQLMNVNQPKLEWTDEISGVDLSARLIDANGNMSPAVCLQTIVENLPVN